MHHPSEPSRLGVEFCHGRLHWSPSRPRPLPSTNLGNHSSETVRDDPSEESRGNRLPGPEAAAPVQSPCCAGQFRPGRRVLDLLCCANM
ncbi:hypothetical protein GCK32_022463 [Trichostrongylus colubriformis]|uniref:Uncharacterized protein n=1 Tax=Trichostrongylus colubriformis TaxID=6319 RepID=A0AAN8FNN3_TRICO